MSQSEQRSTWDRIEEQAREQLELNESWAMEAVETAIRVGLEEEMDRLRDDHDLDDGARWRLMDPESKPMAWLPKGVMIVTMRCSDTDAVKAGCILTNQ